MAQTTEIKGYIEHITFRSAETGYTVLHLSSEGDDVICVGTLPFLGEGELIRAEGQFVVHPSYGEQFRIDRYEILPPDNERAIERYLGSGVIKGIGAAMAARIVRKFKKDTLRIIEEEPERLAEIKGISANKARLIAKQMEEQREMRDVLLFLSQYGISTAMAVKIFGHYGTEIYQIIKENPYRLADDINGIGFKTADEIASKAGIARDSDFRIRSALLYVLSQAEGEGHIYLPQDKLYVRCAALLGISQERMEENLSNLAMERKAVIKVEDDQVLVYEASMYYIELNTARMLTDLNVSGSVSEEKVFEKIARIEKKSGMELDIHQKEAVLEAVRSGIVILTGGPGTGKTTTINTMISYFEEEGLSIALAAPTGRAAKRMTEATGYEAKTLHRLLEVTGGPDGVGGTFTRNADNPLEADVIIVDEVSMVDAFLMYALLCALTVGTRLILVGDVNQLPSVGPGSILRDLIRSGRFRVVTLDHIFRQAAESDIIMNAHRIHAGIHPTLDNQSSKDFYFLQRDDADVIVQSIHYLVAEKLPKYVKASPSEIQVLTPTRKGLLGVEALNRRLQEFLNPPSGSKHEYKRGEILFREGDKVMQIKNNYQLVWEIRGRYGIPADTGTGIFNGDMGVITRIDEFNKVLTVEFDDHRCVDYPLTELEELEHAYAVTIHKSQGSEYPAVVIPLLSGPQMLMNRNLIYTAITRAKSCVMIVGKKDVFMRMIDNNEEQKRYTSLAKRISEMELM